MSYECKHLRNTFCDKRKKECDPGAPGCVLFGKFAFPLKDADNSGRGKEPRAK